MTSHRIFEPERIRALAHPIRLDLLDHLRQVGEATATQCAEGIGESVASCSFHLRMLAKYGFIEPGQPRGREKPWKLAAGERWDMRPSPQVPGSSSAAVELAALTAAREGERFRRFLAQLDREPPQWVEATTATTGSLWATAEEMADLGREVAALTERFSSRDHDPGLRPPGARRGHVFTTITPDAGPSHE